MGGKQRLLRCQPHFSDHISLVDQILYMYAEKKKKKGKKRKSCFLMYDSVHASNK